MKSINIDDILNKELVLISKSTKNTNNIAIMLSKIIKRGDNIFLIGDLGTGKTFFTNCFIKALGIKQFATSPSFKLINEYDLSYDNCAERDLKIFHFDLYRLDTIDEILYLGWDEYLNSDNICIVEWAEKARDIWTKKRYEIRFQYDDKDFNRRIIKIKKVEL